MATDRSRSTREQPYRNPAGSILASAAVPASSQAHAVLLEIWAWRSKNPASLVATGSG